MASELPTALAHALQVQMNREMVAALVYKQMRADLRLEGWYGFHKFFHAQENDELKHARMFDHFLSERGARPVYSSVELPAIPFSTVPMDYFKKSLALEEQYWEYLNELYQMSEDEDDPDTCYFLYQLIEEQHDGVDGLKHIVQKLQRAGADPAALFLVDKKVMDIYTQK